MRQFHVGIERPSRDKYRQGEAWLKDVDELFGKRIQWSDAHIFQRIESAGQPDSRRTWNAGPIEPHKNEASVYQAGPPPQPYGVVVQKRRSMGPSKFRGLQSFGRVE